MGRRGKRACPAPWAALSFGFEREPTPLAYTRLIFKDSPLPTLQTIVSLEDLTLLFAPSVPGAVTASCPHL